MTEIVEITETVIATEIEIMTGLTEDLTEMEILIVTETGIVIEIVTGIGIVTEIVIGIVVIDTEMMGVLAERDLAMVIIMIETESKCLMIIINNI